MRLFVRGSAEFVQDVANVVLDGVLGDEQHLSDRLRRQAASHMLEYFDLTPGEGGLAGRREILMAKQL